MRHGRTLSISVGLPQDYVPDGLDELTEDADNVSLVIILHKELVTIHYVLGEIPRERLVQGSST